MVAGNINIKNKIEYVDIDKILMEKFLTRHHYDDEKINLLAESIKNFGVLQPVKLRKFNKNYELISGKRRVLAAKKAGLLKVPAIVLDVRFDMAAAIAIAENQQREELYLLDSAESYMDFIRRRGLTYSEMAELIGVTVNEVSEKVKILQMPKKIRELISVYDLTKEQIDAAMILEDEKEITTLLTEAAKKGYSSEKILQTAKKILEEKRIRKQVVKDVKIFVNTINQAVEMITNSGKYASSQRNENEHFIEYIIKIEK